MARQSDLKSPKMPKIDLLTSQWRHDVYVRIFYVNKIVLRQVIFDQSFKSISFPNKKLWPVVENGDFSLNSENRLWVVSGDNLYLEIGTSYDHETLSKCAQLNYIKSR